MHVPDGLLTTPIWGALDAVGAAAVAWASWRLNRKLEEKHVPLLGTCGAFVFAAQMLNFPTPVGVSGHFVGGAMVGLLLGPASSIVVLASVLLIQCFLYQDGGPYALGANVVNMGLCGGLVGAAIGRFARRRGPDVDGKPGALARGPLVVGGFLAGGIACVLSSLVCGAELAASGTSPANVVIPALGGVHAVIGVGEGAITAAALSLLHAARPDLLELERV